MQGNAGRFIPKKTNSAAFMILGNMHRWAGSSHQNRCINRFRMEGYSPQEEN